MGLRTGVDILEKRKMSCPFCKANPRPSSHCPDCLRVVLPRVWHAFVQEQGRRYNEGHRDKLLADGGP